MSAERTKFTRVAARVRAERSIYARMALDVFKAYDARPEKPIEVAFRRVGGRAVPYVRFPKWSKAATLQDSVSPSR